MLPFGQAIQAYKKSLLETNNHEVRNKLRDVSPSLCIVRSVLRFFSQAEEEKKKKDKEDYVDPVKSAEANELGKVAFQNAQWPDAIKHYTEVCGVSSFFKRLPEFHVVRPSIAVPLMRNCTQIALPSMPN